MHPPTILASLALSLIALTSASPTPASTVTPTKPSPLSSFYLKTCSNNTSKNNLYVAAYHTGAGQNDAVLVDRGGAIAATINDTSIIFYGLGAGVPWGLELVTEFYTQWSKVEINPGLGSPGYEILDNGTLVNHNYPGFNGWLACDWSHPGGVTQLFWKYEYLFKNPTSNCAEINLVAEEVKPTETNATS